MIKFLMSLFYKAPKIPEPPRYPNRNEIEEWMIWKVKYFKAEHPDELWYLFCPSMADYLPLAIHTSFSRAVFQQHIICYNELKIQNPEAVVEALKHVVGYSIYNGGPNEDYPK